MDGAETSTLRAKYLDWCSARIAEHFLDLTPEEIYSLARPSPDPEAAEPSTVPHPDLESESYRVLVQRVTEALLDRHPLPPFDDWLQAYEASPERYEAEMLGFWKEL